MREVTNRDFFDATIKSLEYARKKKYKGWDKHDGLASKFAGLTGYQFKYLNFVLQQLVKKAPINLRPLLFVKSKYSFKGISLFTLSYIYLFELTGEKKYIDEAGKLIKLLLEIQVKGYSGFCGAHRHPRQQRDKFVPQDTPAIVPTFFGVRALLEYYNISKDKEILDVAISSAKFVITDLEYSENGDVAKIKYKPTDSGNFYILNANALGANLFINLYEVCGHHELKEKAEKILRFVAKHQDEKGGWYYSVPRSYSHLGKDNYHNGFILESFLNYQRITSGEQFKSVIRNGIDFYVRLLIDDDYSPNWDQNNRFPKDIHACAETVLIQSALEKYEAAAKTIQWTLENLYSDGKFFYQKHRIYTNKTVLMRWGQAWMSYAIIDYLRNTTESIQVTE